MILVDLEAASAAVKVPVATLRRWIRERRLITHRGERRAAGGRPPIAVDLEQVERVAEELGRS